MRKEYSHITQKNNDKIKTLRAYQILAEHELKKSPSEMNTDNIDRYIDISLELSGKSVYAEKKDIENRCDKLLSSVSPVKRHIQFRRRLITVIAAAVLISVLTLTAYGLLGSEADFAANIKKIFALQPGESYSTSYADYAGCKLTHYIDLNDYIVKSGNNVLYPYGLNEMKDHPPYKIYDGKNEFLTVEYENGVTMQIWPVGDSFNLKTYERNENCYSVRLNERDFYFIKDSDVRQCVMFDGNTAYVFLASNDDIIMDTIKRIK